MKKRRLSSRSGLSALLAGSLAAVWLLGMGLTTRMTAEYFYQAFYEEQRALKQILQSQGRADDRCADQFFYEERLEHPGMDYWWNFEMLDWSTRVSGAAYAPDSILWDRQDYMDYETTLTVTDRDGLTIGQGNYLWFYYVTEEDWQVQDNALKINSYGWIDMDQAPAEGWNILKNMPRGTPNFDIEKLRLRCRIGDKGQLHPVAVDYVTYSQFIEACEKIRRTVDHDSYLTLMDAEKQGGMVWQPIMSTGETGDDIVTVYAWHVGCMTAPDHEPVPYDRVHDNLGTLILNDTWALSERIPGTDDFTKLFTYQLSSRSRPLRSAVSALRYVYLWSAAAVLILYFAVRGRLIKRLVDPLETVAEAFEQGHEYLPPRDYGWAEPTAVYKGLSDAADSKRGLRNQVARLEQALRYAEDAEQQRRRTTNALAHELKTPLAVVHSYAEGLQLGIAGEKTPAYIQTILKESEKMDGLVMEMLDLSRLEAGKITIARDTFDLGAVTREIFDKMAPLAEKKSLSVELAIEGEFPMVADENRIKQAVENYASNAMKYTPEGGAVKVSLLKQRDSLRLTVENTCQPLSKEALERVWEPFYRADAARTTPGTGLGLAITATVIQLHRGKVGVENTAEGVRFWFSLPI